MHAVRYPHRPRPLLHPIHVVGFVQPARDHYFNVLVLQQRQEYMIVLLGIYISHSEQEWPCRTIRFMIQHRWLYLVYPIVDRVDRFITDVAVIENVLPAKF